MTWQNLPPEIRQTAEQVLTQNQLMILKLGLEYPEGARYRPLALRLGITRTTVIDTWDRAHQRLHTAGITTDAQGHYHHNADTSDEPRDIEVAE